MQNKLALDMKNNEKLKAFQQQMGSTADSVKNTAKETAKNVSNKADDAIMNSIKNKAKAIKEMKMPSKGKVALIGGGALALGAAARHMLSKKQEKTAALAHDHTTNSIVDALIGRLPLGTTLSTAFGERPDDHSRLGEWASRIGGGALGAAGLGLAGGLMTKGNPEAMRAGVLLGAMAGEGIGSHMSTKKYYNKNGKLKKHANDNSSNKEISMNENFINGFLKQAALSEDHSTNTAVDTLVGRLPLGTTIATMAGKRPHGHSRLGEWGSRVGGAIAGGIGGVALGALAKNPRAAQLGGLAGAIGGEAVGSHLFNKKHYGKDGKLKASSKKQE